MKILFILALLCVVLPICLVSSLDSVSTVLNINFANTVPKIYNCPKGAPRLPNDTLVEFKIVGLTDLAGVQLSEAPIIVSAWKVALYELNLWAQTTNAPYFFTLTLEDTVSDPAKALAAVQRNFANGVRVFLGPTTSAEVAAVQTFVTKNKITIISPSSTSSELSVQDTIYRLVPSDTVTATVLGTYLASIGKTKLIIAYRSDSYGFGFEFTLETAFYAAGGQVVSKFGYSDPVNAQALVNTLAAEASFSNGPTTAVVFISFDEWVSIAAAASIFPSLNSLVWAGPELASTQNIPSGVLSLAGATQLLSVQHSLPFNNIKSALQQNLVQLGVNGSIPLTAYYGYDSFYLAALSFILPRTTKNPLYSRSLEFTATQLFLSSGRVALDEDGDRGADLNFDIIRYQVDQNNPTGNSRWVSIAKVAQSDIPQSK